MNSSHSHCTFLSAVLCFLLPVRWRFMGRGQCSPTVLHDCQMKVDSSIFYSWTRSEWHIKGFLQNRDKTNTCFYCFAKLGFKSSKKQIVDCSLKLWGWRSHYWLGMQALSCPAFLSLASSPIIPHAHQSLEQALSYLTLCLCPCCTLGFGALLSSCCLYLKTHLTPDFSDLDSFCAPWMT